jgi:hypothetical protein
VSKTEKLNQLATQAQLGSDDARRKIYSYYLPIIEERASRIWYLINNEAAFVAYCQRLLESAIMKYDRSRGSFDSQVKIRLRDAQRFFIKDRGRKRRALGMVDLGVLADHKDDGTLEYRIKDALASVEDELLVKEKIALLAKGDSRKKAILLAWSDGFYNDSALSELLAQLFGGKPESHRQAIKRFRSFCQASLAEIA